MFEVKLYQANEDGSGIILWRSRLFNLYSDAIKWIKRMKAIDLEEFRNSEEFTGEYPYLELFFEINSI
jgi:hypothetical protein